MPEQFTQYADETAKKLLQELLDCREDDKQQYQEIMTALGVQLAEALEKGLDGSDWAGDVCIACTVEDADFLAKGILTRMERSYAGTAHRVRFACFWNESSHAPYGGGKDFEFAPIIKAYEEPVSSDFCLIMVKSIVSGACVLSTNITRMISEVKPKRIFVAAPVMLKDAELRLAANFNRDIAEQFELITFRIDDQRTPDGTVLPGIGGEVYKRYGFRDSVQKNLYVPEIVKERRRRPADAVASR